MSMRSLNLHSFHVDKWSIDLLQFFDLDEDYNGGNGVADCWEFTNKKDKEGNLIPLCIKQGFKNEAERLLKEIDDQDGDDHTRISVVLDYIGEFCHGSYSTQFKYNIDDIDSHGYIVSVAFLTD